MTILVINGPNLNMVGQRDSKHYGSLTLGKINELLAKKAEKMGSRLVFFQSNHEGAIIDFLQKEARTASGILINPGALTHYGFSLRDALADTALPVVEVHLSDISRREAFRKIDVLDGIVIDKIVGLKEKSYIVGIKKLIHAIQRQQSL